ncbi:hypothetical protein C0J52_01998 [Blattella germanica]|nr:hypothetical protein C0J52_01998 [Blattella germanica]
MQTSPKSEVKMTENVLPLPKSKLPECWTDDMRMNYLYSSIRPATVNPLDCESKMKFWSALLQDWCIHHSRPVFTLDDVKKAFLRNGRTPACLPSVLENMLKNGDLVAKSNYINDLSQQTWTAWTVDMLVKRPASWAFTKIKDTINKTPLLTSDTALVYVAACKIVSNNLISNHKEQLLELSELATLWGQQDLEQVLVLVHALRKEGKAAIQEGCPTLIKLGSPQITEVDIGVHALRKNEKTLTRHVEQLETEKQMAIQEARTYLAKNMRQAVSEYFALLIN